MGEPGYVLSTMWCEGEDQVFRCGKGKHEAEELGTFRGVAVLEDGPMDGVRICRHCRCLFVGLKGSAG